MQCDSQVYLYKLLICIFLTLLLNSKYFPLSAGQFDLDVVSSYFCSDCSNTTYLMN